MSLEYSSYLLLQVFRFCSFEIFLSFRLFLLVSIGVVDAEVGPFEPGGIHKFTMALQFFFGIKYRRTLNKKKSNDSERERGREG